MAARGGRRGKGKAPGGKPKREPKAERSVIIANYLDGGSNREAARLLDNSPDTVGKRLKELLEMHPDLEELRELNRKLKTGPGYEAVARAANVLTELMEAKLDPPVDALVGAAKLVTEHKKDYEDAIGAGQYIISLEKSERKPFREQLSDAKRLKTDVEELKRTKESAGRDLEKLKQELGSIEPYKQVKKGLDDLHIGMDADRMNDFITRQKTLDQLRFDYKSAEILGGELSREGMKPEMASRVVMEAIKRSGTLDKAVSDLEDSKKRLEGDIRRLQREKGDADEMSTGAKKRLQDLTKAAEGIAARIEATRGVIGALNSLAKKISKSAPDTAREVISTADRRFQEAVDGVKAKLDEELNAISKSAQASAEALEGAANSMKETATDTMSKMKAASKSIVSDMDKVGQQAFDTGKEIERLEPISKVYRFMAKGEGEPNEVFHVMTDAMQVFLDWEKKTNSRYHNYYLEQAVEEAIENWKR